MFIIWTMMLTGTMKLLIVTDVVDMFCNVVDMYCDVVDMNY